MRLKFIEIFCLLVMGLCFQSAFASTDTSKLHLLLLGNTTNEGSEPLAHAFTAIDKWRGSIDTVLYIAFASLDPNDSFEGTKKKLGARGIKVVNMNADEEGRKALLSAKAVFVCGGSTFKLLDTLQRHGFLKILRKRILEGMPYLGSSAGTNIIAPTIMTTNDMPIVAPKDFNALDVLPFQINPHFTDSNQCIPGESREDRLLEYVRLNDRSILALRQGAWITVDGNKISLEGTGARVFRHGDKHFDKAKPNENKPRLYPPGTKFDFSLEAAQ